MSSEKPAGKSLQVESLQRKACREKPAGKRPLVNLPWNSYVKNRAQNEKSEPSPKHETEKSRNAGNLSCFETFVFS